MTRSLSHAILGCAGVALLVGSAHRAFQMRAGPPPRPVPPARADEQRPPDVAALLQRLREALVSDDRLAVRVAQVEIARTSDEALGAIQEAFPGEDRPMRRALLETLDLIATPAADRLRDRLAKMPPRRPAKRTSAMPQ